MNRSFAALLIAAGVCLPALRPLRAATPIRKENLDEMVTKLEANADLWLQDKPVSATVERQMRDLVFDKDSVRPLSTLLRSIKKDDKGLYVIGRLLRYLSFAKTDVVQAALSSVKSVHSSVRRTYRPFPKFSKAQEKALSLRDYSPRLRTPAIMKEMATVQKRREAKLAGEKLIAKHNELVYNIEKTCYQLMLLAKDQREDKFLVNTLLLAERRKSSFFVSILDQIAADARKMDRDRAQGFYNALKPHGVRLKMERERSYQHFGKASLSSDRASSFGTVRALPGAHILKTMNRLATPAKLPALKVPTKKEIDAFHKKKGKGKGRG